MNIGKRVLLCVVHESSNDEPVALSVVFAQQGINVGCDLEDTLIDVPQIADAICNRHVVASNLVHGQRVRTKVGRRPRLELQSASQLCSAHHANTKEYLGFLR